MAPGPSHPASRRPQRGSGRYSDKLLVTGLVASLAGAALAEAERDRLLSGIEAAFRRCRAAPLQRVLPPKLRVHLEIEGVPPGWVGPDQLFFLLERWFSGKTTLEFHLRDPGPGGPGAAGTAAWKFREGGGAPRALTLEFRFAREGEERILTGIRSLP